MGFVIGSLIGLLIVRGFFLNFLEDIGFRMFVDGLINNREVSITDVLMSSTFAKFVGGYIIGGLAGEFLQKRLRWGRNHQKAN